MWISIYISKLTKEEMLTDTTSFKRRAMVIEEIINRELRILKIKVRGVQKISITLTVEQDRDFIAEPLKGFSPVINLTKSYDFKTFDLIPDHKKNEVILSMIERLLSEAQKKFNWDKSLFKDVFRKIRDSEFCNVFFAGGLKSSKNKKFKAGIEVVGGSESAIVSIVFYNKNEEELKRFRLIKTKPSSFFINQLIGKSRWIGSEQFELINKNGEIRFTASMADDSPSLELHPKDNNRDRVIDDLLIISAESKANTVISILKERLK